MKKNIMSVEAVALVGKGIHRYGLNDMHFHISIHYFGFEFQIFLLIFQFLFN